MTQADSGFPFDLSKLDLGDSNARRRSVTAKATASKYQEKRRKEALFKQQQARADRTHEARQLALQRVQHQVKGTLSCDIHS